MNREDSGSCDFWYFEKMMVHQGSKVVAGVDEAGRGPLAGPVVASAVILPIDCDIEGINDSKKLTPKKRDAAYEKIMQIALGIGVGIVDSREIDSINILQATIRAMLKAVMKLPVKADILLVDGNPIRNLGYPHKAIVGGDGKSASIAAASIIAKVTRDRIMCEYDALYPQYGFAKHKGYGSEEHLRNLAEYGACDIHRRSFAPVRNLIPAEEETNQVWVQTNLLLEPEEKTGL